MNIQRVASKEDLDRLATLYQKNGLTIIRTLPLEIKAYDAQGQVKHVVRVRA